VNEQVEAIVRADGRQVRLAQGMEFEVNRVHGSIGARVDLPVMMLLDGDDVTVGEPLIEGATVTARITGHGRAPKLRFMKYKNKVRYRRTIGHRQDVSRLVVESISRS
jgi:large subunit ribosomal protein L21